MKNLPSTLLGAQEIQYVCNLAEHCGEVAVRMHGKIKKHQKSEPNDWVTDADMELSRILREGLSKRFPNDHLVSEEDHVHEDAARQSQRIWYVDPIDGTDNYIEGDGQYAVMIGIVIEGVPHFGCVHCPARKITYYGGPEYGCWSRLDGGEAEEWRPQFSGEMKAPVRVFMGSRDRKSNPWVHDLAGMKIVSAGSVGIKVAKVIDNEADLYVHLSGQLKYWDTAGPLAIALAAGLEAGSLESDKVEYPSGSIWHRHSIIVGRPGSLSWAREVIGSRLFS